jgi:uncharacterized tellurite resistance protein B-like protein
VGILSFFKSEREAPRGGTLLRAVRAQLPNGDDDFVKTVAAVAGLLGQVAYVDRPYLPEEEAKIRAELSRVEGLSSEGLDAICRTLRDNIAHIAEIEAREYATVLRELAEPSFRLHVLDLLLDVAAADDVVSSPETNLIRRLAEVLGLTQADYNASQARHRDKLAALKRS